MADTLYDLDFPDWADRQASLLERLAHGERVNDAIDWPHVIEEVRDLGRSELHAVEGLLARALEHLLKLAAWPDSAAVTHWSSETLAFLLGARRRWAPSMAQRIALDDLYADALAVVRAMGAGRPLPEACPYGLANLVMERGKTPDIGRLTSALDTENRSDA
jgi:hypothetical protein